VDSMGPWTVIVAPASCTHEYSRCDNQENRIWSGRSRVLGSDQAVPSRFSATARPTKGNVEWPRREGLAVHGETRMINRAGKRVASARRHLSDWPCRRIRTAEDCSAPLSAKVSPATHDAAVAIFDNRSRDREAFLPLGISPWR
jgi:hypothetical protein